MKKTPTSHPLHPPGMPRRGFLAHSCAAVLGGMLTTGGARAVEADDPLAPWQAGVSIRPVSDRRQRHTIHSYYLTCPESPDGSRVLFYASTTPEAHRGDLIVLERATNEETVVARGI